jgi:fimbrial chaperone protein
MMAGLRWLVEGRDAGGHPLRVIFTQDDLNRLVGSGYVGPSNATRIFQLPVPTAFGPGPINVRFAQ